MTRVPFLDLTRFDGDFEAEASEVFSRFVRAGKYILGPEVENFEAACAASLGVKHALGVSSGTDALLLSLMSLEIGAGDEVLCPAFTFFATAGTIHRSGATPVFTDIDLADFNSGAAQLEPHINEKTKAIIVVHLFGQCAELAPIRALAEARGIALIEDAAQAFGARDNDNAAGSVGTFGCFSFFPSKNLGGFGDAGLVTTGDEHHAERARILRTHGGKPKYYHHAIGGNFRIDALQAALLALRLRRLDAATAARAANAAAYTEIFKDAGIGEPNVGQGASNADLLWPTVQRGRHIFNQFCIRVPGGTRAGAAGPSSERRDALRQHLTDRGIGTQIYYPVPMHMQPCFAHLGYAPEDFSQSLRASAEALALPIFPELSHDELRCVAKNVTDFFGC